VAVFIARVTAVGAGVDGTITVSTTAKTGTAPTVNSGARSIKVGGAWQGPNAASGFPFSFVTLALTNTTPDRPRFNFKNDAEYTVSAAVNQVNSGPMRFQGYTTTPGDGGRAVLTGNGVASSIVTLTLSGTLIDFCDFIVRSNGTSGAAATLTMAGNQQLISRVTVNKSRGHGFSTTGVGITLSECEAFDCGNGNTANGAGFDLSGTQVNAVRCISHDNTNANIAGFHSSCVNSMMNCIADSNGTNGLSLRVGAAQAFVLNCDFYNNGGSGIMMFGTINSTVQSVYIENCNFIKNARYGFECETAISNRVGVIRFCGFGSGTAANTLGTTLTSSIRSGGIDVQDTTFITYASNLNPWVDPANGDFRINLAAAYGTGRGLFMESSGSYAGTIGYPSIGAAQPAGFTNGTARGFSQ
jgi:hypothetical protein